MNLSALVQGVRLVRSGDGRETYVGFAVLALVLLPILLSYLADE